MYCDDSKEGGDLAVVGAVVLGEDMFHSLERYLMAIREHLVPPRLQSEEFKASAMFHGRPPFEGMRREAALEIFRVAAKALGNINLSPIFYGAVDIRGREHRILAPSSRSRDPLRSGCWLQSTDELGPRSSAACR